MTGIGLVDNKPNNGSISPVFSIGYYLDANTMTLTTKLCKMFINIGNTNQSPGNIVSSHHALQ